MAVLVFLAVLGAAVWVFFDAPTRQLSRWWTAGVLALAIVAFPAYLVQRTKYKMPPPPGHPSPPGWYPDPVHEKALRWFDGQRWSDAVRDS
jgi:uncharacterized protein DUF2510